MPIPPPRGFYRAPLLWVETAADRKAAAEVEAVVGPVIAASQGRPSCNSRLLRKGCSMPLSFGLTCTWMRRTRSAARHPASQPSISRGNGGDGRGSSDGGGGGSGGGGGGSGTADSSSGTRGNYRGQALQYLDCALPVAPSSNNGSGTIPVLVDR